MVVHVEPGFDVFLFFLVFSLVLKELAVIRVCKSQVVPTVFDVSLIVNPKVQWLVEEEFFSEILLNPLDSVDRSLPSTGKSA